MLEETHINTLDTEKQQIFPQLANSYTWKYLGRGMDWHYLTGKKKLDLKALFFHLSPYPEKNRKKKRKNNILGNCVAIADMKDF